jgi:hypothetical protein
MRSIEMTNASACVHTFVNAKQSTPICGSGYGTPRVQVSKNAWLSLFQKGKQAILRRATSEACGTHELQQLLDVQGLPPTAYQDGESLLCLAASLGDTACVELLYQRGGNLNEGQPQGQTNVTALEMASWMGHEPVVDFLLAHGAFLGRALHYAAKAGHGALVKRLLDCHAHPDMTVDGQSPLVVAVLAQQDEIIEKLVNAGAKVLFLSHTCAGSSAVFVMLDAIVFGVLNDFCRIFNGPPDGPPARGRERAVT